MKVCIAEKPSVAKEIAYIIGAKSRKDGYFEGNGYAVTWTFGHLCMLHEPDDYKPHWKKWSLDSLPMLPEKFDIKPIKNQGVGKQLKVIKSLFKQAEVVINCGDAGQEGELIQRWVMKLCKYKGPVQRLWISSLTAEAIKDGFTQLKPASDYDNLFYAGYSRAIGDWLLGMNATRLYTLKYGGFKQVLSVGRVQTPTLAMIVDRHLEIVNFVPKTYWELQTTYRNTVFNYEKGKFEKIEDGQSILDQVTGHPFTILSFNKKKGKEQPPRLFDLTSLQVHCNKRFGYSADQTLKIAQKLYEQKIITYPRVDTTYLPDDVYPKVAGVLAKMQQYNQFTPLILNNLPIRKSKKVFNNKKVTDHHAIIPTGYEKSLPIQEQNVYDAVARKFVAAFYPDCIISNTTVIGEANTIKFKATGKEILEPGWRVLFPKPSKKQSNSDDNSEGKKQDEEKIIPTFTVGENGPHDPKLAEKQTKPPKYYTEATLLRAMETAGKQVDDEELRDLMKSNGIGRPATRASIIETLFRRKFIERKRKNIHPTDTGVSLITTIHNPLLKSAELTGQWERNLRDIETGAYSAKQFIKEMKQMVDNLVFEVRKEQAVQKFSSFQAKPTQKKKKAPAKSKAQTKASFDSLKCPKCFKGALLKGSTAYGCARYKEGCDFRLNFEFQGKKISDNQLLRLMAKGCTVNLKGFVLNGRKVEGLVRFDDNKQMVFEPKSKPAPAKAVAQKPAQDTIICPKCKKGKVLRGKTAYGCSAYKTGCDFRFGFDAIRAKANGRKLTKELVLEIISGR